MTNPVEGVEVPLCLECGYSFDHPAKDDCDLDQNGTGWIHPMVSGAGMFLEWHPFQSLREEGVDPDYDRCTEAYCQHIRFAHDAGACVECRYTDVTDIRHAHTFGEAVPPSPEAPTSEPPREETGGWKRFGEIGHGDVHWRNEARDIDAIVPLAVEAAIRAPLEAEVARLNDVLVGIDRDRVSNAYLLREKARRALTPDEGGK